MERREASRMLHVHYTQFSAFTTLTYHYSAYRNNDVADQKSSFYLKHIIVSSAPCVNTRFSFSEMIGLGAALRHNLRFENRVTVVCLGAVANTMLCCMLVSIQDANSNATHRVKCSL